MARDSTGLRGQPIYDPNGAPSDAADLTEVAQYASDVGNRKAMTKTLRQALSGSGRWVGLTVYETDTGDEWTYTATGWYLSSRRDTGWQLLGLALNSGWSVNSADELEYRVVNRTLYLNGRLRATVGASQSPFATVLPVGARPSRETSALVGTIGGDGRSFVGTVTLGGSFTIFKGGNSVLDFPLQGIPAMPV